MRQSQRATSAILNGSTKTVIPRLTSRFRLNSDTFLVVTGAAAATRDFVWLKKHIGDRRRGDGRHRRAFVAWLDGTEIRDALQAMCDEDISDNALPYRGAMDIEIGYAPVRAVRIVLPGELGYEIYVSTEFAQHVFDRMMAVGEDFDLRLAGYHAMDHCVRKKGSAIGGTTSVSKTIPSKPASDLRSIGAPTSSAARHSSHTAANR